MLNPLASNSPPCLQAAICTADLGVLLAAISRCWALAEAAFQKYGWEELELPCGFTLTFTGGPSNQYCTKQHLFWHPLPSEKKHVEVQLWLEVFSPGPFGRGGAYAYYTFSFDVVMQAFDVVTNCMQSFFLVNTTISHIPLMSTICRWNRSYEVCT